MIDISEGGLFIFSPERLIIGTNFRIQLRFGPYYIDTSAIVIRQSEMFPSFFGIELGRLGRQDRDSLLWLFHAIDRKLGEGGGEVKFAERRRFRRYPNPFQAFIRVDGETIPSNLITLNTEQCSFLVPSWAARKRIDVLLLENTENSFELTGEIEETTPRGKSVLCTMKIDKLEPGTSERLRAHLNRMSMMN